MRIINLKNNKSIIILLMIMLFFISGCQSHYTPKPRGYFRITLPKHEYKLFDSVFPYTFEYPKYVKITPDPYSPHEKYWINIHYPQFRATIHISYKAVHHNLIKYLKDARKMVVKHIPKANAINDSLIINPAHNIFGMVYDIEGNGVASPYQFIITDSSKNFLRGSLYFNLPPNNDSLSPVIDFIKEDIRHILKTFSWKKLPEKSNR